MLRRAISLPLRCCRAWLSRRRLNWWNAGKLTWGASVTFPPFEFQQNDKPAGFDVDLVDALAKKMNSAIEHCARSSSRV